LLVRGSVPGPNGTCIMIRKAKKTRKPVVVAEPKAKAKK
jgi:ribosomal protein L3